MSALIAKIKITLKDRDAPLRGRVVPKVVRTCDPTIAVSNFAIKYV